MKSNFNFKRRKKIELFLFVHVLLFTYVTEAVGKTDESYFDIANIQQLKEDTGDIKAMIADQFHLKNIIIAKSYAVYTLDLRIGKMSLIVGNTSRGYLEGVGSSAQFVDISTIEIGPTRSKIWVGDFATGCIREINLRYKRTTPIAVECTYVPNGYANIGLPLITSLSRNPKDAKKYYASIYSGKTLVTITAVDQRWRVKRIGSVEKKILDIAFLNDQLFLLSSGAIFGGLEGANIFNRLVDGLRESAAKSLFVINNQTLLITEQIDDITIVNLRLQKAYSFCQQLKPAACFVSSARAIVKYPGDPGTYLLAGSNLHLFSLNTNTNQAVTDGDQPVTTRLSESAWAAAIVGGLLIAATLGIIIIVVVCHIKLKKLRKKQILTRRMTAKSYAIEDLNQAAETDASDQNGGNKKTVPYEELLLRALLKMKNKNSTYYTKQSSSEILTPGHNPNVYTTVGQHYYEINQLSD